MVDRITLRMGETDVELTDPDEIKEFIELQKKQVMELIQGVPEGEVSADILIRRKVAEYLHRSQGTSPEVNTHRFDQQIAYFSVTLGELSISPSSDSKLAQIVESLKEANVTGDMLEDDLKRIEFMTNIINLYRFLPNSPEKGRKIEDFINTVDFAQLHTVACYPYGRKTYLDSVKLSTGQEVSAESHDYSKGDVDIDLSTNGADDMEVAPMVGRLIQEGKPFTMVTGEPGGYVFSVKISISELDENIYNTIMERLSKLPITMHGGSKLPITKEEMEDILSQVGEITGVSVDFAPETLRNTDIGDLGLTDDEKNLDPDKKRQLISIIDGLLSGYNSFNFYQMVNGGEDENEIPSKLAMKKMHFHMDNNEYLDAIDAIHEWTGWTGPYMDSEKRADLAKQFHGQIIDDLLEFHKDTSGKFEQVNASWKGTSDAEDADFEFDEKIRKAPLIFAISQFLFRMDSIHFNRFDTSIGKKVTIDGKKEFDLATLDEVEQKIHALDDAEITPVARKALDDTLKEIEDMRGYY